MRPGWIGSNLSWQKVVATSDPGRARGFLTERRRRSRDPAEGGRRGVPHFFRLEALLSF
jgi:hypothetical protein